MTKYIVTGRIRADLNFEEEIIASSEENAVNEFMRRLHSGLEELTQEYEILDDEMYCDESKESA